MMKIMIKICIQISARSIYFVMMAAKCIPTDQRIVCLFCLSVPAYFGNTISKKHKYLSSLGKKFSYSVAF